MTVTSESMGSASDGGGCHCIQEAGKEKTMATDDDNSLCKSAVMACPTPPPPPHPM